MKRYNIVVTAGVIGIIFLILIPLPTFLLDFFFILNITLSLVILCMAMYIRETLEFSVFPSMLLITTLFRLGLNISSTRKILFDNGYAGQVVKTFGEFVIRGNAIIGFIIFLILFFRFPLQLFIFFLPRRFRRRGRTVRRPAPDDRR